ncbi:MAG: response regulator transcription factor, partial [Planctomycetales bacterium]|nr:response regulator transcription factor [Planctomycetales bacterium]
MSQSTVTAARVLVVDDHPMMREGITIRIANEPDLCVCGEAEDIPEAVQKVEELKPDLVIVDLSLKSGHGINLIKRLRDRYPKLKMLVNSMYEERVY